MKLLKSDYVAQTDKIKKLDRVQQKACYAMLDGAEIVDDAGNTVEVVKIEMMSGDGDAPAAPPVDTAAAARSVQDQVDAIVKASIDKINTGTRPDISVRDRGEGDPKAGFKHFGEFGSAVAKHVVRGGGTDDRLNRIKAPTNYANEAVGADGGFLVPQDFATELLKHTFDETALLPLTRKLITNGNTLTIPVDESTPWGGTGVQAYWTAEGAVKTDSKPKIGEANITLHKLAALVPVTDELLQDSFIGLGQYLGEVAAERIREKVNTAIVSGTGVGQPLGYRNSGALVTVAKTASQTADTVSTANVASMLGALSPSSMAKAVWLHHSSVFGQLVALAVGNQPVWTGPLTGSPFGTLFGRPLLPVQTASVLGDLGDIDLVDLSQYVTVTKSTGIEQAMSIHLYFDRDITTFRFVFRIGGRPWMSVPITQKDGTTTISPFVTLAERA